MADTERPDLAALTVELLSAFVANNSVQSGDLAELIRTTHAALAIINAPPSADPAKPEFQPAVSVRKSLGSRDHILSLIDGKPYKTLKRHLAGHGLTPAEYRARYSLPADYPMTAPAYSEHRRAVANTRGFGRKRPVKAAVPVPIALKSAESPVEAVRQTGPDTTAATVSVSASKSKAAVVSPVKKKSVKPRAAGVEKASDAKSSAPSDAGSEAQTADAPVKPAKKAAVKSRRVPGAKAAAVAPAVKDTSPKTERAPRGKRSKTSADIGTVN